MHLSKISLALRQWGNVDPNAAIKALFANGEQGAWYDPSDLTTMFQDRVGSTSVTADGQTVGIILDKSKELVLGSELVIGSPGPYTGNGTVSVAGDTITATCTTNGVYGIKWNSSNISNVFVKITIEVVTNSVSRQMGLYPNLAHAGLTVGTSTGQKQFLTLAPTASGGAQIPAFVMSGGLVGESFSIKLTSIKELAGNHAVAPSDAARPQKTSTGAADWINYDAVNDVLNSTFPSSLGSSCTVCRANVGAAPTILTGQTIGTSYADSTDNAGLIIINRALTAQETTDVTAWLLAKGATS